MTKEDQMEADPQAAAGPAPASPPSPGGAPDFEELVRQHRQLDDRLRELTRAPNLSPREQLEAAVMKKRKLALKDRIAALASS